MTDKFIFPLAGLTSRCIWSANPAHFQAGRGLCELSFNLGVFMAADERLCGWNLFNGGRQSHQVEEPS